MKNSNLDTLVQMQTRLKRELLYKAEDMPGNAWWACAGEAAGSLHTVMADRKRSKAILDLIGKWFAGDFPPPNGLVNTEDKTLRWVSGALQPVAKSSCNKCYTHLPVRLAWKPSDDTLLKLRAFLCTTFAGRDDARAVDESMEVLALDGQPLPHKMIIFLSNGGNGKSAKSKLRANFFGGSHRFAGSKVFQQEEEFRKQGRQFAQAKCITIQECQAGKFLQESDFKNFVSGGRSPCRPNFGIETVYISGPCCAKYWELNPNLPAINGDPTDVKSLWSFVRRLIVLVLESEFVTSSDGTSVDDRIFVEDPSLESFLEGQEARYAYVKYILLPRRIKYTRDELLNTVMQPGPRILQDTLNFVRKMANGGLRDAEPQQEGGVAGAVNGPSRSNSELLVCQVHEASAGLTKITETFLQKLTCIPGLFVKESKKGKPTRIQNFRNAVEEFPYLFKPTPDKGFTRLNIDVQKFTNLLDKCDHSCFGCWHEWGSAWDVRSNVRRLFYDNADPESEEAALDMGEIVESEAVEMLEVVAVFAHTQPNRWTAGRTCWLRTFPGSSKKVRRKETTCLCVSSTIASTASLVASTPWGRHCRTRPKRLAQLPWTASHMHSTHAIVSRRFSWTCWGATPKARRSEGSARGGRRVPMRESARGNPCRRIRTVEFGGSAFLARERDCSMLWMLRRRRPVCPARKPSFWTRAEALAPAARDPKVPFTSPKRFTSNYTAWRDFMGEYLDVDAVLAKKSISRIFGLGMPESDVLFLWSLASDVAQAAHLVLQTPDNRNLQGMFSDRAHPRATRFSTQRRKSRTSCLPR